MNHTSYLSFLLHRQIFESQFLHPKALQNTQEFTRNTPQRCKICSSLRSIWKNLHQTEFFYTGTAPGARDKYEVCDEDDEDDEDEDEDEDED